jgi:glycosyltransferase involved in cell wall biosynthesis
VLLEAMAAGTPIVSTAVGGVPEAVGAGEAWLVPPEDPDALARAMTDSLVDRATAAQRVAKATERLNRDFAIEPWLDQYEDVYRTVYNRVGDAKRTASRSYVLTPTS